MEEVIEFVRARCPRKDLDNEMLLLALVGLVEVFPAFELLEKVTREFDVVLPLISPGTMMSCSTAPSSRFRLRRVAVEAEEIFRERLLASMAPRSSEVPAALKWDWSVGCVMAEVKASRTGKGVRLRI